MKRLLNERYAFTGVKNHVYMSKNSIAIRDLFVSEIQNKDVLVKQNCYVCGVSDFRTISEIDRYGFYYPTAVCEQCGNVQQKEYYDNETLTFFYSDYYRKIYGDTGPPELFASQREGIGAQIFNFTQNIIQPKKVLEVGCGAGGILSRYFDAGFDVLGLDFDEKFLDEARKRKIPVKNGSLEKLRSDEKFDLIILSHVLEHIVNPAAFLQELVKHLTDEGVLYIEVPSLDNVGKGGYNYDLLNYWQNAHTIHFTIKSLILLCKKAGLNPIEVTTFIHSCWKKSGNNLSISDFDKADSLEHSKKLLSGIETSRKSYKSYILRMKSWIRFGAIKVLGIAGLEPIAKSIYRKLKI